MKNDATKDTEEDTRWVRERVGEVKEKQNEQAPPCMIEILEPKPARTSQDRIKIGKKW